jgi:MFS superfamily sulfate permease-like transporter
MTALGLIFTGFFVGIGIAMAFGFVSFLGRVIKRGFKSE